MTIEKDIEKAQKFLDYGAKTIGFAMGVIILIAVSAAVGMIVVMERR